MIDFLPGVVPNDRNMARVTFQRSGEKLVFPQTMTYDDDVLHYMAYNDKAGCCTVSSADKLISLQMLMGQNQQIEIADAETILAYSAISGYDPRTGRNDNGATLQDALNYWRKSGIGGYYLEAFAQINITDDDMIKACTYEFGGTYAALMVPDYAMDQFNTGQPWDIPKGNRRARMLGGHAVPVIGFGPGYKEIETWGQKQIVTDAFFERWFDEIWATGDTSWQRADGSLPSGIDGAAANADFQSAVGAVGPWKVAPTPVPVPPGPVPVPTPSGDARAYLGQLRDQITIFLNT
jgi:hypothetical protein